MNVSKDWVLAGAFLMGISVAVPAGALSPKEELGKKLFFDVGLSANSTQSCASCHAAEVGFTGPDSSINSTGGVYEGALPGRYGNRKPPASAYCGDSPLLHRDSSGNWIGGMFWDGRATGAVLGDPLSEQAQGPFLNPLEQALHDAGALCTKVSSGSYASLFEEVWGAGSLNCETNAAMVYENIGRSVAAYERSSEVNPYSSKFDRFWDNAVRAGKDVTRIKCGTGGMMGGMGGGGMGCSSSGSDPNRWSTFRNFGLSDAELMGLAVFNDSTRANCASCHTLKPGPNRYPLFTDFSYDNIGIPKNPANPFYRMPATWNPDGAGWIDYGLGGYLKSAGHASGVYKPELGKFKVPTLRNVDLRPSSTVVKAYGHNGYFKSLRSVVFFYHWRGMMDGGCGGGGMGGGCGGMAGMFPPPEVDQNRAKLGVFPGMQVDNIVLFLKTLSDGYYHK